MLQIKSELISLWNDETTVLDNARVSVTGKVVEGQELSDRDIKLLHELVYFEHHVPLESIVTRWKIDAPIFVVRQLVKHRIASMSEKSKRYRGDVAKFYMPEEEALEIDGFEILTRDDLDDMYNAIAEINKTREAILKRAYNRIENARANRQLPEDTKNGRDPWRARARELVRGLQTVSEETNLYFTINFRSLMNFFWLRRSEHAQYEIRIIADQMYDQVREELPVLMSVVDEYFDEKQKMYESLERKFKHESHVIKAV